MKKIVFSEYEDFTQDELKDIFSMVKALEVMDEKEKKVIIKAVEVYKSERI